MLLNIYINKMIIYFIFYYIYIYIYIIFLSITDHQNLYGEDD